MPNSPIQAISNTANIAISVTSNMKHEAGPYFSKVFPNWVAADFLTKSGYCEGESELVSFKFIRLKDFLPTIAGAPSVVMPAIFSHFNL